MSAPPLATFGEDEPAPLAPLSVRYAPGGTNVTVAIGSRPVILSPVEALRFAAKVGSFAIGDARPGDVEVWSVQPAPPAADAPAPGEPAPSQPVDPPRGPTVVDAEATPP